jgi:peptidoglycan/LPS O-acetylase OafA/YrhL
MQNVGVLLFFIISGFLITHTLVARSENPNYDFSRFFIDRFARIYSGLIPALVFIVVVDAVVIHLTEDQTIARYYNLKTLVANLFMLESYRGFWQELLRWPTFGSASPLWTLAIEWHIYMFVGAVFFMFKTPRARPYLIPLAIFFGQTPAYFLLGALQPDGVGSGLFSLWLGGSAVYLAARAICLPRWLAIAMTLLGLAVFLAITPAHAEYSMTAYPLLLAAVFGTIAATQTTRVITSRRLRKTIEFFADYSFSLYLIHHTIMYGMFVVFPERGLWMFSVSVCLSNLVAITLAAIGERHHRTWSQYLGLAAARLQFR